MAILPLLFVVQPLIDVFALPASSASALRHGDPLLYMLGIPAIVPATLAAYSIVGERQQGTLEPVLATPIRREEFLLAKALAAIVPSLAIAYAVYAFVLACIELFADPAVASALVRGPEILAQLVFTPLLAGLVDLDRHSDLHPIERRPGRPAARHAREPSVGRGHNAHRVRRDPRDARPCRRPARSGCWRSTDSAGE